MRSLARAFMARCPVCGAKGIWQSFGDLSERCPSCRYRFSREEGYWAGALIVNLALAMALFFVIFVGGMLVTWPEVPWTLLLAVTLLLMALAPVALYPQSKTIWVWLDQRVHPYEDDERDWELNRETPRLRPS